MFKTPNEFSIHIENIKLEQEFSTYIEAVVWFHDNETDAEMEDIVKMLNSKILGAIEFEATSNKLLKDVNTEIVRLL